MEKGSDGYLRECDFRLDLRLDNRLYRPIQHNFSDERQIRFVDAFAALITAFDCVEQRFPHDSRWFDVLQPVLATPKTDVETPIPGKLFRTDKPLGSGLGVFISPLNIHSATFHVPEGRDVVILSACQLCPVGVMT